METTTDLKIQWEALKAEEPKLRIRDAAKKLKVSEAELLATGTSINVIRLNNDFQGLLKEAANMGKVMALTRNDHCVHERKGIYKKASFNGHVGLVVTPDIDLRLFMNYWSFGFAVNENDRRNLQFFDASGEAVHKIYLIDESDQAAYSALVIKYRNKDQSASLNVAAAKPVAVEIDDDKVDVASFQEEWKNLQDTHDFHPLLRKFHLSRTQALRLAPEGFVDKINISDLKSVLQLASEKGTEIMVFTGSNGCIQIHTGPIHRLVESGPWFNVLDPDFNMHLRLGGIHALWLVKKPTKDGLVHSLEAYDADGKTIVQFFGKRKPGIPESEGWRELLTDLN